MFLIPLIIYIAMLIFALPKPNLDILWYIIISLISISIGFILSVLFHELGHGVLGHFAKYRLLSFKFLMFEIYYDDSEKMHFKINPINSVVLGQCLMLPPKVKKNKVKRFYLYNAGGLVFSYLWSLILLVLFLISNTYLRWMWMGMMLINVFLILNNSHYTEGGINDRCNAVMVKKNSHYVDAINYQLTVMGNIYLGKRFGAKINATPYYEEKLNHITVPVVEFMMYNAIDHGDFVKVKELRELLERNYIKLIFPIQKIVINFDLLWVDLVVDKSLVAFKRHFRRFKESEKMMCKKPNTDMNFYYRLYEQIYNKNYDLSTFIGEIMEADCFYKGEKLSLLKRMDYLQTVLKEFE